MTDSRAVNNNAATATPRWLPVNETAQILRKVLKREFPGVRFSVRCEKYSGGAAINVAWTDGPLEREVEPVTQKFRGSGFDGSIDLKYRQHHYLRPDGSVLLAHTAGTQDNHGAVPRCDNRDLWPVLPGDAELVSFGADHISARREMTDGPTRYDRAVRWIYENYDVHIRSGRPHADEARRGSVADMAHALVANQKDCEDLRLAYRRVYGPPLNDESGLD